MYKDKNQVIRKS